MDAQFLAEQRDAALEAARDGDWENAPGVTRAALSQANGASMRTKARNLLANRDGLDAVLREITEGVSIAEIARKRGLDYYTFYAILRRNHWDKVQSAKHAMVETKIHENFDLADGVAAGRIDAAAGRTAAGIRQWMAERMDPENYGQRSSMDVNVKGTIGLHLAALRELNDKPLEGEIEDADYEEIVEDETAPVEPDPEPDIDSHPLL